MEVSREQIFGMTDDIAERARKLGGFALRSIGDIVRHRRIADNDETDISAVQMLSALRDDNRVLTGFLRETHDICDTHKDVATASLIENWIDQSERRTWFLGEAVQ
jgi:starvation-inducible DNA-binding protein